VQIFAIVGFGSKCEMLKGSITLPL